MEDVERLIHKFKEYEETHPNIAKFWITYLEVKKKSIEGIIEQGYSVVSQLENKNDMELEDLINMMMVKMTI
jgi:hypothetical protein